MCIGFKFRKRGGGDVPFGHLAPVIQFVTPSRWATLATLNCTVAIGCFTWPETNFHMHVQSTLPQAVLSQRWYCRSFLSATSQVLIHFFRVETSLLCYIKSTAYALLVTASHERYIPRLYLVIIYDRKWTDTPSITVSSVASFAFCLTTKKVQFQTVRPSVAPIIGMPLHLACYTSRGHCWA